MMPLFLFLIMATPSPILTVPVVMAAEITPDPKVEWIVALHNCENVNSVQKVLDTNNKFSYGYLMFQMKTWLDYGKDFGTTRGNISDDELQKTVARKMLDDGGWRHWYTCALSVRKSLGPYPRE